MRYFVIKKLQTLDRTAHAQESAERTNSFIFAVGFPQADALAMWITINLKYKQQK